MNYDEWKELKDKVDRLNGTELKTAYGMVTEILKSIINHIQPERSKREDYFGMKATVIDGILEMENGEKFDLNQPKEDAVL